MIDRLGAPSCSTRVRGGSGSRALARVLAGAARLVTQRGLAGRHERNVAGAAADFIHSSIDLVCQPPSHSRPLFWGFDSSLLYCDLYLIIYKFAFYI